MRVTLAIKNYIEEQVRAIMEKKYPCPTAKYLQDMFNARDEIIDRLDTKYSAMFAEELFAELEKIGYPDARGNIEFGGHWASQKCRATQGLSDLKGKRDEERIERNNAVKKALNDIIVSLELGGDKATLDKMLEELGA